MGKSCALPTQRGFQIPKKAHNFAAFVLFSTKLIWRQEILFKLVTPKITLETLLFLRGDLSCQSYQAEV